MLSSNKEQTTQWPFRKRMNAWTKSKVIFPKVNECLLFITTKKLKTNITKQKMLTRSEKNTHVPYVNITLKRPWYKGSKCQMQDSMGDSGDGIFAKFVFRWYFTDLSLWLVNREPLLCPRFSAGLFSLRSDGPLQSGPLPFQ